MLVEFIVCIVIGYNLYENTACVALIFVYHPSRELDSLANPVSAFLLS